MASMSQTFTVTTTDGKSTVATVKLPDLARADVLRARKGLPTIADGQFINSLLFIYCSLVRTGEISINTDFDKWMETVEDFDGDTEVEAAEFPAGE